MELYFIFFRLKIENETGIDIGYWESLLSQLQVHLARTRLRHRHQLTLKRKLRQIKQENNDNHRFDSSINDFTEIESSGDLEIRCQRDYERACFSPVLIQLNDLNLEDQKQCIDEIDDREKLNQQRQSVIKSGSIKPNVEDVFESFIRNMDNLTSDDLSINTVVPVDVQYLWSDKYRPRKPRVYNKVHTVCS